MQPNIVDGDALCRQIVSLQIEHVDGVEIIILEGSGKGQVLGGGTNDVDMINE
jgi:hypothetical protein